MTRFRAALILIASMALAGCGDPNHPAALVGTWKLDPTQGTMPARRAALPPDQRKQFDAMVAPGMVLTLQANGTGTLYGSPGKWEIEGRELHVHTNFKSPRGDPDTGEMVFGYALEDGGKTLHTISNKVEMVWRKQDAEPGAGGRK